MEKADFFSEPVELEDEVGQDAIETVAAHVELLMLIGETRSSRATAGRERPCLEEAACARIGEVEVKPKPAVGLLGDRLIDVKLFGEPVGAHAKGAR